MRIAAFSLPLLTKELTEQSARGRTYFVRATYVGLLYAVTLWGFYRQIGGREGSFSMLGTGHLLFQQVLVFQLLAVFVLLPMQTAGVLTAEKERDTLGILLITRLGPWTIVLEKFLSRIIPMLLYLSASLPLMAVAYSLGGVETGSVLGAALLLIAVVIHIGSFGVFASACCRTTTQALLLTYAGTALLSAFVMEIGPPQRDVAESLAILSGLGLIPAVGWLTAARSVLWPRAFLQPKNWWLNLLQWFDGIFHRLNQNRVTKGIVLFNESVSLPLDQPIAWRETKKRSLGTARYLLRFLLVIEWPLVFGLLVPLSSGHFWTTRNYWPMEYAAFAVWWVTAFAVLTQATGLIAGERARQSLDVLLSTPLSAEEIVREKFAGVWRMIFVLWVPLVTVFLFRGWWYASVDQSSRYDGWVFFVQSIGAALVYPPLLGWLGFHCSARFRSQVTAMSAALGVTIVLGGLPWALDWVGLFQQGGGGITTGWIAMETVLLPATGPNASAWNLQGSYWRADPVSGIKMILLLVHFAAYAGLTQILRRSAPRALIRHTGRCHAQEPRTR